MQQIWRTRLKKESSRRRVLKRPRNEEYTAPVLKKKDKTLFSATYSEADKRLLIVPVGYPEKYLKIEEVGLLTPFLMDSQFITLRETEGTGEPFG